jgi:hypothetical protein
MTLNERGNEIYRDRENKMKHKPTIYEALVAKLGRLPSNAEIKADVERIKRKGLEELASKGKLSFQRRRRL